jgi:hypothetical protein
MKRFAAMFAVAGSVLIGVVCQSAADPLDTMEAVGAAIMACWHSPPNTDGSAVTLSFSFDRDGNLLGPPMPTDIAVAGDEDARQQFVDAAIQALESCMPLSFTPGLAAGLAGNPFTMRFTSPSNQSAVPPIGGTKDALPL